MSTLWLPSSARPHRDPKVSREHRHGTRQWEAAVKAMLRWTGPVIDHWNPELQRIDRDLRLTQAYENAVAPGVLGGYYHLVRLNEAAPMWVQPLMGPHREFIEPSSAMLTALRMCDLQNPRAVADRHREDELAAKRRERDQANEAEARQGEIYERYLAGTRTQVLMSRDVRWAQNAAGAKRPTRGRG